MGGVLVWVWVRVWMWMWMWVRVRCAHHLVPPAKRKHGWVIGPRYIVPENPQQPKHTGREYGYDFCAFLD